MARQRRKTYTMGKSDPGTEYLRKLIEEEREIAAKPMDLEELNRMTQQVFGEPEALAPSRLRSRGDQPHRSRRRARASA